MPPLKQKSVMEVEVGVLRAPHSTIFIDQY